MTTGRRRRNADAWSGEHRDASVDSMFASMGERAQRDTGLDISVGSAAQELLVGLPLPAFCLRYLFQSTTFPLSRIHQITGEEGSCKSSLMYEMFRWHMTYGGGAVFCENENKDSPELRNSLLTYNEQWIRRIEFAQTHSLEDWQEVFTGFLRLAAEQQDAAGGPGRTIPVIFAVDSLMSTAPREEIDAVAKDGFAKRGFALAANLIARYMRTMPQRIKKYPFTIVGTNHLKPSTDFMGRPTAQIPGGKAVKFMETYEIEMHRAPSPDIDLLEYGGIRLKLVCRKNGLGPSRKQIAAELLWWQEAHEDGFRQATAWDWDTATIELLLSFDTAKGKKTIFNRLQEICDIRVVNKGKRQCYSRTLGIGSPNDPVLYRQMGAALERRPDIMSQMYPVLGITPRAPFQPGVDYRTLLDQAAQQAEAEAAMLYADIDNMPSAEGDLNPDQSFSVDPDESGIEPASAERAAQAVTPPAGPPPEESQGG